MTSRRGRRVATAAIRTAAAFGFNRADIVAVLGTLDRRQFVKSMTSYNDHTVWQDVYHVPSDAGLLYVKFKADTVTEFKLLSFKEKADD